MKVLDLFAGLEGWSGPWRERGHEVVSVDIDPRFGTTLLADLSDPARFLAGIGSWRPDVILASPPCEAFSVMNIGRNWTREHTPKTAAAAFAVTLVESTRTIIAALLPAYFVIENPRAKLRRLPPVLDLERRTVTYCQFGERTQKPTDLWGGFPPSLVLAPTCLRGSPCHVAAPRGSRTGIQGDMGRSDLGPKDLAALRAKVPAALSLAVCLAAELDLAAAKAANLPLTLWESAA